MELNETCLGEANLILNSVDLGKISKLDIKVELDKPVGESCSLRKSCSGTLKISQYKIGEIRKHFKDLLTAQRLIPIYNRTKNKRIKWKLFKRIFELQGDKIEFAD